MVAGVISYLYTGIYRYGRLVVQGYIWATCGINYIYTGIYRYGRLVIQGYTYVPHMG